MDWAKRMYPLSTNNGPPSRASRREFARRSVKYLGFQLFFLRVWTHVNALSLGNAVSFKGAKLAPCISRLSCQVITSTKTHTPSPAVSKVHRCWPCSVFSPSWRTEIHPSLCCHEQTLESNSSDSVPQEMGASWPSASLSSKWDERKKASFYSRSN